MFFNNTLVEVSHRTKGATKMSAAEIAKDITNIQALTVYPKIKQTATCRIIEPVFSYVPIRSVDVFYDSVQVIELVYQDNYHEKKETLYLDPYNKVYTTNKGYISAGNLGNMDVLLSNEGRICKIISKERQNIYGDFFKMELKYGNNIVVNGLVAIPK
jgi:hypothetical protein